jgi:arabinogalactan endo-1,4-beta-galactosidase
MAVSYKQFVRSAAIVALAARLAMLAGVANAQTAASAEPFYFGADLSYVNEMEDCGAKYRVAGAPHDPFTLFKAHGFNLVRVRLWNNPDVSHYSNLADVEKTLGRARAAGMQTLLDFHYSDTWADGEKQIAPKAWANIKDTAALARVLYQFTYDTLRRLDSKGLMPDLVQVGNETNSALLGSKKGDPIDWARNAALFNAGIQAVHDAGARSSLSPRIMLHIAQPEHAAPWFDAATVAGVKGYDIIGLSYYSKWSNLSMAELGWTIRKLRQTYGKDVMVVETAYPWTLDNADSSPNLLGQDSLVSGYPASPAGQEAYLVDLAQTVKDSGGDGVVYWEPAWVSTPCRTPWSQGSAWDNATFFDFHRNDAVLPGIDFPRHIYTARKDHSQVDP